MRLVPREVHFDKRRRDLVLSFEEVQLWVILEVRQLFKDKVDTVMQDVEALFFDELAHV